MNTNNTPNNLSKEIYNFNEACVFLDYSKSYLYKLTHSRKIVHFKPNGKKIYFKKGDLEAWLLRNRVKTEEEIEQEATDYVALNSKAVQ